MTEARLKELLSRLGALRIAVVGDLFLDRWWEVDTALDEPSVETGLTAYQVTGRRQSAGAAGTVLNNLAALGVGTLRAVSLAGEDGEGWEVLRLLRAARVDVSHVHVSPLVVTPAYIKPMFQAGGPETEGNRFDIKNRRPTPPELEEALVASLFAAAADAHAVVVLDQLWEEDAGVVTAAMRQALTRLGAERPDLLIWADSRAFLPCFQGVTLKCNDLEAQRMALDSPPVEDFDLPTLERCLALLGARSGHSPVVTCGARGVLVEEAGVVRLLPALPVTGPIDVCGCGDACTAGMVSALCAGATRSEAAELGNLCAAVTIRKLGTTGTAAPAEVLARYREGGGP